MTTMRGLWNPFTRYEVAGKKAARPKPGGITTMAVGEEGGSKPQPKPKPGGITTMAVGEEGGSAPHPDPVPRGGEGE